MMNDVDFCITLIGKPWRSGAQGEDAFDCWGLVRFIYKKLYAITLPVVCTDAHNFRKVCKSFEENVATKNLFTEVQTPQRGDVILMHTNKHASHCGVYIADGVLHAVQGSGVVFSSISYIKCLYKGVCFFRLVKNGL